MLFKTIKICFKSKTFEGGMDQIFKIIPFVVVVILVFIRQQMTEGKGQYSWLALDNFDDIDNQIRSVNAKNCRSKSRAELFMREDTVAQLPVYNQLLSRIWYKNRTSLIHIHNMALNRAFFYSYILQRMNDTATFTQQPNWLYFYMSAAADINANPSMINASAIYFDNHCHYPNWYTTVPFNRTIPLFGPKAYRWDDSRDTDNFLGEPSRQVVQITDAGAGRNVNYTHANFKMNPWYPFWMPDMRGDLDSLTKFTYYIAIKYSNQSGRFQSGYFKSFSFFGPTSPSAMEKDRRKLPVYFTPPYFDCGGSNKWVVSAVSPVVDFMPRYSNFTHLRRQRIVAAVVMDTDFIKLDFNACGVSSGNPGPSYLSGIARCRKTTGCKHKMGYGFKRGGYVCVCKPGRKYPWWLDPPFQGESVEQATEDEYSTGFVCDRTDYRQVLPNVESMTGIVEGGGLSLNAGGLKIDLPLRQRRSAETGIWMEELYGSNNNTGFLNNDHVTTTNPDQDPDHEYSPAELYSRMNNVHVGVEKMYKEDLRSHQKIRRQLLENGPVSNFTHVILTLSHSIQEIRGRHIQRFLEHRNKPDRVGHRSKRAAIFDEQAFDRMMRILRQKRSVNAANCHKLPEHLLRLPGDVSYGVKKQFHTEGRTALRLTHFLSMYLQNVQKGENFGYLRGGGPLHVDQMFGEVIANVMGNFKIYSAGLYFDRYKFENTDGSHREMFGPWAYRKRGAYYAIDRAGLPEPYLDERWFRLAKERFSSNFYETKQYKIRPFVRSDPNGTSTHKHEYFPLTYRAATYKAGIWTEPYFRCDGKVNAWVMTYISPFYGLKSLRTKLEFRGVATVDVPLDLLHIHQCPQPYRVANAFKNTARCDYFSSNCKPQSGFPFMRGSYRCLCRLGFEYWHLDGKFWIEGSLVESEFEKKKAGYFSRFDLLKCRISFSPSLHPPWTSHTSSIVSSVLLSLMSVGYLTS